MGRLRSKVNWDPTRVSYSHEKKGIPDHEDDQNPGVLKLRRKG